MNKYLFQSTFLGSGYCSFAIYHVSYIFGDIDGVPPPDSTLGVIPSSELSALPRGRVNHF